MAISEIRTQIYLEREQHEDLKREAQKRSVSMAQVVREAVAVYLMDEDGPEGESTMDAATYLADSAWQLPALAREAAGGGGAEGPSCGAAPALEADQAADLAENHDDYLYGPRS